MTSTTLGAGGNPSILLTLIVAYLSSDGIMTGDSFLESVPDACDWLGLLEEVLLSSTETPRDVGDVRRASRATFEDEPARVRLRVTELGEGGMMGEARSSLTLGR